VLRPAVWTRKEYWRQANRQLQPFRAPQCKPKWRPFWTSHNSKNTYAIQSVDNSLHRRSLSILIE